MSDYIYNINLDWDISNYFYRNNYIDDDNCADPSLCEHCISNNHKSRVYERMNETVNYVTNSLGLFKDSSVRNHSGNVNEEDGTKIGGMEALYNEFFANPGQTMTLKKESELWQATLKLIEIASYYSFYFNGDDILELLQYLNRNRHHVYDVQYQRRIDDIVQKCNQLFYLDIPLYHLHYSNFHEYFHLLENGYDSFPNYNI